MSIKDEKEINNNRRSRLIKIVLLVLTFAVMVFIFQMSAMDAENSSALSTSV